jgi:beta-N-acetylhexosaminidase
MTTDWTTYKKAILGVKGLTLTEEEILFFKEARPFGFIIFKRNIQSLEQLAELINVLKDISGSKDISILIDQEGGKVARLRPPLFDLYPPASLFGKTALDDIEKAKNAVFTNYYNIGLGLKQLGINVNCAPVADLLIDDAHNIIGDRSFSHDVKTVVELCNASDKGLRAAGVRSIMKHIPGHGRADVDSHESLPIVRESLETLEKTDFAVFKELSHIRWAMTAHIIYECLDPYNPATQSAIVINYIRNKIGFKNILISDDLSMKALKGDFTLRAKNTLDAGCDLVLHCNGDIKEMKEVIEGTDFIDDDLKEKIYRYRET